MIPTWFMHERVDTDPPRGRDTGRLFGRLMQIHMGIVALALLATSGWYLSNEGRSIWSAPDVWITGAGLLGIAVAYLDLQRGAVRRGALLYLVDCAAVALIVPFIPGGHAEIGMLASLIIPVILAALIYSTPQLAGLLAGVVAAGFGLTLATPLSLERRETAMILLVVVAVAGVLVLVLKSHLQRTDAERSQRLNESSTKYRTLFDTIDDGIFVADQNGVVMEVSQGACRQLGYFREELIGKSVRDFSRRHGFDFGRLMSDLEREGYLRYRSVHARKNGGTFPVELSLTLLDIDGVPRVLGVARDISEHVAECSFRDAVLSQVTDGLCVCHDIALEPHVLFTIWNPKMVEITGYTMTEINAAGWYRTLYPDPQYRSQTRDRMNRIRDGEHLNAEESVITTRDGQKRTVEISTAGIEAPGGFAHVLALVRDVTEQRRARHREREAQARLERAKRMEALGQLAGGVAHDLNNMLGPVIGYAEMLLHQVEHDEKLARQARKILASGQSAADVVGDLLALGRRGRYEMAPIDLNAVLQQILDSPNFEWLVQRNPSVSVTRELATDPLPIRGSEPHLVKAIMNLVANALDAMPAGGTVTIRSSVAYLTELRHGFKEFPPGIYAVLGVKDTGTGIRPEDVPRIFEPYFSRKQMGKSSGSGLGLSVVYGVLKDHGGYYDIETAPGRGTEFILYFPLTTSEEPTEPHGLPAAAGRETVLVIDDSVEQREMTCEMLGELGYAASGAASGAEAAAVIRTAAVDIVVLDMILDQGSDGLDTYRSLLDIVPGLRALIVSGYSQTERVHEALRLGAHAFVPKPYTRDQIGAALRAALDFHADAAPAEADEGGESPDVRPNVPRAGARSR